MKKLIVMLAVVLIAFSCNDQSATDVDPISHESEVQSPEFSLKESIPISLDHQLVTRYFNSHKQALKGLDLILDNMQLASYENTDVKALLIPVLTSNESQETLIAYFNPQSGTFKSVIWQVLMHERLHDEVSGAYLGLSANVKINDLKGQLISGATFKGDELISIESPNGQFKNSNDCFADCFEDTWDRLPWYVRGACQITCGGCLFAANPIGCAVCVGCLGGYSLACAQHCGIF